MKRRPVKDGKLLGKEKLVTYDLDKNPNLAEDQDQQLNELARIVVEFYREWKRP